jgi:hypothetical protein
MYQTNQYEGMLAETVTTQGYKGDIINAYLARPLGSGPFPGLVVVHHLPGRLRRALAESLFSRRPRHTGGCRREGARGRWSFG